MYLKAVILLIIVLPLFYENSEITYFLNNNYRIVDWKGFKLQLVF